jgi:hypothetical protein
MLRARERERPVETIERTNWLCAGCGATFGEATLDSDPGQVVLETRQISARLTLPVTRLCGRCGTPNYLVSADLMRWRRRGGGRPLRASWPPAPAVGGGRLVALWPHGRAEA